MVLETRMTNTELYRERLNTRRTELVKRLNQLEDWLDDPADPDAVERATERESDEVFEIQGVAGQEEVAAIDAALARIDNGVYGTCLSCSEPISAARLDAVPHAALCRNCMT